MQDSDVYIIIIIFAVHCPRGEQKLAPGSLNLGFKVICEIRNGVKNNLKKVKSERVLATKAVRS